MDKLLWWFKFTWLVLNFYFFLKIPNWVWIISYSGSNKVDFWKIKCHFDKRITFIEYICFYKITSRYNIKEEFSFNKRLCIFFCFLFRNFLLLLFNFSLLFSKLIFWKSHIYLLSIWSPLKLDIYFSSTRKRFFIHQS